MTTERREGWWSDLLEFVDERTSVWGFVGVISSVLFFLGQASGFVGLLLAPVYLTLLIASLSPGLAWLFSSSLQRPRGGLVGVGPSIVAIIGVWACTDRSTVVTPDDGRWTYWLLWPAVALATSGLVAWRVGLRRFRASRMAWVTSILSAAWVPVALVIQTGLKMDRHTGQSLAPFVWAGMPAAIVLIHLAWASYAIAMNEERPRLSLRVFGRCEVLVATGAVVVGCYLAAAGGWRLTSRLELTLPTMLTFIAMGWHGIRLSRWAAELVDEDRSLT